jgi:hypothetical protein
LSKAKNLPDKVRTLGSNAPILNDPSPMKNGPEESGPLMYAITVIQLLKRITYLE